MGVFGAALKIDAAPHLGRGHDAVVPLHPVSTRLVTKAVLVKIAEQARGFHGGVTGRTDEYVHVEVSRLAVEAHQEGDPGLRTHGAHTGDSRQAEKTKPPDATQVVII